MECIASSPTVTDLVEVYLSSKDFNAKDHDKSNITEDIQKFNDKQVAREHVENIEENLRHVVRDVSSNEESCYHSQEKLENNGASSVITNTIHSSDRFDLSESSKENELRIDDKKFCDTDNSDNTVKKISNRSLSIADNDFAEGTNLDETLNKNVSIVDNEYRSGSPEYIAECRNNSKNKSLNRILDSESEEDSQINENNNFPQLIDDGMSTVSNHITYKRYHNVLKIIYKRYKKYLKYIFVIG